LTMDSPRSAIRLGIDFGSTTCRAAYVHPGSEKVVVPVPLPLDHFRPCFPIAEDFRSPDRYCSRFFPGLTQRLRREFQIGMRNQPTSSRQIAAELVQRAIQEAESFAGRPIESLILSAPVTLNDDARNALTQAITLSKLPGELRSDVEAACAAFRQTELGDSEHTTVLILSAGYTGAGVAAARVTPRGIRMLARAGDPAILAGNVLDFQILQSIMRLLQEQRILIAETQSSLTQWTLFRSAVELAKESMGDQESVQVRIPESLTPEVKGGITVRVDGLRFRELVNRHTGKALEMVNSVLEESGIKDAELGHVLLNGGTTHLPDVVRRIKQRFPDSKVHHLAPDAVASGAALLAMESGLSANGHGFLADDLEYLPDPVRMIVPGLVDFLSPLAGQGAATPAPVAVPVPPTPEQLELAAFKEKILSGHFDREAGELADLAREIQRRLNIN